VEKLFERHLDRTEDIEVNLFPRDKVFEMLNNGVFKQSLMIAPLWKYFYNMKMKDER
jgi:hypothetical protein